MAQPKRECKECGAPITKRSKRGLCAKCGPAYAGRSYRLHPQIKRCENCGLDFDRGGHAAKRFCCWDCYIAGRGDRFGENAPGWKGDDIGPWGHRRRSLKAIESQPCEVCGKPNADRHHVDRDISNNDLTNIRFLCRSHHVQLHHREGDASTEGLMYVDS